MNKIQHRNQQHLRENVGTCLTDQDSNYLIAERVVISPRVFEFLQKLQTSTVEVLPILEALRDAVEAITISLNQADDQGLTEDLLEWLYADLFDRDSADLE